MIKESGRIHFVLCRPAGAKGGETPSAHILETFSRVARLRQPLDYFAATSAPSVVASILSRAPKGSTDSPQPFLARLSPGERAVEILPFERLASMDASRLEAFFLSWVEMGRLPYFSIVNKDNFSELLTMKRNGGRTLVLGVVRHTHTPYTHPIPRPLHPRPTPPPYPPLLHPRPTPPPYTPALHPPPHPRPAPPPYTPTLPPPLTPPSIPPRCAPPTMRRRARRST